MICVVSSKIYIMRILFFCLTLALASCVKRNSKSVAVSIPSPSGIVLSAPQRIDAIGFELPKGSRILNDGDSVIRVTIPKGYGFIVEEKSLPYFNAATYRCNCSASGSACKVFYQEDLGGFGCIHSSCTGSCTGSFIAGDHQVIGVLNTDNHEITARVDQPVLPASLRPGYMNAFFDRADVQQAIADEYSMLYGKRSIPDFDRATGSPDYVYVPEHLYGVSFYLLVPAEVKALPNVMTLPSTAVCNCTVVNGGACVKKARGMLGYHIYWCEGPCNGCSLTIK